MNLCVWQWLSSNWTGLIHTLQLQSWGIGCSNCISSLTVVCTSGTGGYVESDILVFPVHLLLVTTCVPEPSIIVYRGIGCTKANQCDRTAHSNAWGVQWHRQILWSIWNKTETDGRLKEEIKTNDAFPQEKLTDWQQITLQTLQKMMTIIMTIQHYVHLCYRFRSILK